MNDKSRIAALEKLAFFGYAGVDGSPSSSSPVPTVGQAMYGLWGNQSIPGSTRRSALNGIVGSGMDVNKPVGSLLHAGIGALAGNLISNMFGAGPFTRGMATAIGANYGYRH